MKNGSLLVNGIWITIPPHVVQLYSSYLLNRGKKGEAVNYKAIINAFIANLLPRNEYYALQGRDGWASIYAALKLWWQEGGVDFRSSWSLAATSLGCQSSLFIQKATSATESDSQGKPCGLADSLGADLLVLSWSAVREGPVSALKGLTGMRKMWSLPTLYY